NFEHPLTVLVWLTSLVSVALTYLISYLLIPHLGDGTINQQKSDGDAATWLPPNKAFRCDYVARQISVKSGYGLWVTQAEHDAMARILGGCPDTTIPAGTGTATPNTPSPAAPVPAAPGPAAPAPAAVFYANCAAARAAGAAPLRSGQPGYREQMDGDRDGIACE
ncbi:MAG: excalibur calcium-binding domain-containing protein, partial [Arthrobacter sp.]